MQKIGKWFDAIFDLLYIRKSKMGVFVVTCGMIALCCMSFFVGKSVLTRTIITIHTPSWHLSDFQLRVDENDNVVNGEAVRARLQETADEMQRMRDRYASITDDILGAMHHDTMLIIVLFCMMLVCLAGICILVFFVGKMRQEKEKVMREAKNSIKDQRMKSIEDSQNLHNRLHEARDTMESMQKQLEVAQKMAKLAREDRDNFADDRARQVVARATEKLKEKLQHALDKNDVLSKRIKELEALLTKEGISLP